MTAYCITFRPPRVSHVFLHGHKVITEAAPRHVGGSISVMGVENTNGEEERERKRKRARKERRTRMRRKESRDGQAGVNETSSSSNFWFVNFRGSEPGFASVLPPETWPYIRTTSCDAW